MVLYDEAKFRPVTRYKPGVAGSIATKMPTVRRLILHTAVSGKASLFSQFNVPDTPTSHFYVLHDGTVEQYINTAFRSSANLSGNRDSVTVESQDVGGPFPVWDTRGSDVPAWTPKQVEALARLAAWVHVAHGVPLVLMPSSKPGTRGVGWHRQGIDPFRVTGGEVWSKAKGKVCPGDRRVDQVPKIIARAMKIAAEQTRDVPRTPMVVKPGPGGIKPPARPPDDRWKVGVRKPAYEAMGKRFLKWLTNDEIARAGDTYKPGPEYSAYDDFNVRKVQALMGDAPDPAGKAYLGPLQWARLFKRGRPAGAKLPAELTGRTPPQLGRKPPVKQHRPAKPGGGSGAAKKPTSTTVPKRPSKQQFDPGTRNAAFTAMGKRFLVWLKANEIHKAGAVYTPGPRFSVQDARNVRVIQALMGDKPDVDKPFFGPKQWRRLFLEGRPSGASVPAALRPGKRTRSGATSDGRTPVAGHRITTRFGKPGAWAAGEHTGVDLGSSGDDTIRCVGAGTVITADEVKGWGKRVIVRHSNGRFSWYCHLASIRVKKGQKVSRGTTLGVMGETGRAFGKHLHYQETTGGTGYFMYKRPTLLGFGGY